MLETLPKISPMMLQWLDCKQKCPHAILLFRLGDFYEAFEEDATLAANVLELTLTKRQETPMCGVPAHAVESYIDKLLAKGFCVAVAEQVEDPKATKGLVRREVVKIFSPGTLIQSSLLQEKQSNYLVSITQVNAFFGIASCDLSTGDFSVSELESPFDVLDEIAKIAPKEILTSQKTKDELEKACESDLASFDALITIKSPILFDHERSCRILSEHFAVHSLDAFGLKALISAINAAGALLMYLKEHLLSPASNITTLRYVPLNTFLALDKASAKHLELFSSQDGTSLVEYLDRTKTPMGARLLKRWLAHPLLEIPAIQNRQDAIEELLSTSQLAGNLQSTLSQIRDIERLATKLQTGTISPRDLLSLAKSLSHTANLIKQLENAKATKLRQIQAGLFDFSLLAGHCLAALSDTPPIKLADGGAFRAGFDQELDECYSFRQKSHEWIAEYQTRLKEETQIKTLKVGFTRAFGYYIEVSKAHADKIPANAQRRQTLITGDRFVTQELKQYEEKLFSLEDKINARQALLFARLTATWKEHFLDIITSGGHIAKLDVLVSLAHLASLENLTRPVIDTQDILQIDKARHPIIEKSLPQGQFVPNSLHIDHETNRIYLITGPNMGGKSTFIRQVAILVIMAQMGSFVPAAYAHIGIVDKVFTRIGASDNLFKGQSTFMVEMGETANILNHATKKSLVILDEIGRGTSTYDGIAIASSVVEYLSSHIGAKTLFATHYGELTDLEQKLPNVKNLHVAVQEAGKEIVFLHRIAQGPADRSYGIHVAKIAGMPSSVIKRAEEVLLSLEKQENPSPRPRAAKKQLELFSLDPHKEQEELVLSELKNLDLNNTTPLGALELLAKWQKRLL